ncbi:unnamed protein product, partial [Amoebophrya sp. A25]|eukprot:GSA25T00008765001.1
MMSPPLLLHQERTSENGHLQENACPASNKMLTVTTPLSSPPPLSPPLPQPDDYGPRIDRPGRVLRPGNEATILLPPTPLCASNRSAPVTAGVSEICISVNSCDLLANKARASGAATLMRLGEVGPAQQQFGLAGVEDEEQMLRLTSPVAVFNVEQQKQQQQQEVAQAAPQVSASLSTVEATTSTPPVPFAKSKTSTTSTSPKQEPRLSFIGARADSPTSTSFKDKEKKKSMLVNTTSKSMSDIRWDKTRALSRALSSAAVGASQTSRASLAEVGPVVSETISGAIGGKKFVERKNTRQSFLCEAASLFTANNMLLQSTGPASNDSDEDDDEQDFEEDFEDDDDLYSSRAGSGSDTDFGESRTLRNRQNMNNQQSSKIIRRHVMGNHIGAANAQGPRKCRVTITPFLYYGIDPCAETFVCTYRMDLEADVPMSDWDAKAKGLFQDGLEHQDENDRQEKKIDEKQELKGTRIDRDQEQQSSTSCRGGDKNHKDVNAVNEVDEPDGEAAQTAVTSSSAHPHHHSTAASSRTGGPQKDGHAGEHQLDYSPHDCSSNVSSGIPASDSSEHDVELDHTTHISGKTRTPIKGWKSKNATRAPKPNHKVGASSSSSSTPSMPQLSTSRTTQIETFAESESTSCPFPLPKFIHKNSINLQVFWTTWSAEMLEDEKRRK